MTSATASFHKMRRGLTYVAEVIVDVEADAANPGIECRCSGRGFTQQGAVEEVPATGYDRWKAGAFAGAEFALTVIDRSGARVTITSISGLSTDTNPSIVAAATALAVWKALRVEPPSGALATIENAALTSWERPSDDVPVFALPGERT